MSFVYAAFIVVTFMSPPDFKQEVATFLDAYGPYDTEKECMNRAADMGRDLIKANPQADITSVDLKCKEMTTD